MSDPRYKIRVEVVSDYLEDQSSPDDDRYLFSYTVTIRNEGTEAAKLLTRHWIITDGNGLTQEVRGPGVVGEQPRLEPGESFQYTSGTPLSTPMGSMRGSYRMISDEGIEFDAEIKPFGLLGPATLH
ncbi:Co2+/Mg2+ efflux protein ApaG [Magnetofaba australis]|uniref:Co2+/Mg2+ efflux protein ApaG n=1 Tax=Magnetofaba australis TaxID=1472297 RepID=UPI000A19C654|nr:Co2+/Mg2+ efflux protein ApaG [Magnetofaba australis]